MNTQFSFAGNRANKENASMPHTDEIMNQIRNNKENIPPNDITRSRDTFGREIGNIPRKNGILNHLQKNQSMRRSLTMDMRIPEEKKEGKRGVQQEKGIKDISVNEIDELNGIKLTHTPIDNEAMDIEDKVLQFDKFDMNNKENPQVVADVAKEIFVYLLNNETYFLPTSSYMSTQHDINEKMRAILIDWLVDVNVKFKLVPETQFMTVNLIDRYLSNKQVTRHKLQLVGQYKLINYRV